jgi:SAM-dependent methyltransferase
MALDERGDGYVSDLEYTWGFYRELSPTLLSWTAALAGHVAVDATGPFQYLELGSGNGLSTNLFAACHPEGSFYGVDFNPQHIKNAEAQAAKGKLGNVKFIERSFADLLDADLPDLDFVTLHGVWSWISPENRAHLRAFFAKKLKPGGILYISYNALPGWGALEPVRRLMLDYARTLDPLSSTEAKVKKTLDYLRRLREAKITLQDGARVEKHIDEMLKANPAYVAHEYFNADWWLFYFRDVAHDLGEVGLHWAGSAHFLGNEPALRHSAAKKKILEEIADAVAREQMRDHFSNTRFRRDVFVKGTPDPAFVWDPAANPALRRMLIGPRRGHAKLEPEVKIPAGTLSFKAEPEQALFASLADGPRTVEEIFDAQWSLARTNAMALTSIRRLLATDQVRLWTTKAPAATWDQKSRFKVKEPYNRALLTDMFAGESKKNVAVCPPLGSAVTMGTREAYLLDAIVEHGLHGAVGHALKRLEKANKRLIVNDKPLQGRDEHLRELSAELDRFKAHKINDFLRLGVLEVERGD